MYVYAQSCWWHGDEEQVKVSLHEHQVGHRDGIDEKSAFIFVHFLSLNAMNAKCTTFTTPFTFPYHVNYWTRLSMCAL